jgi:prepilin-type N-terminal cleavage/methylation domain-containing protein
MTRRVRRGFTLVEIVVAMALTLAVFAITLPFVRAQTRALGSSAGRLDADQIARYAQRAIDRDLRLAGGVAGQPLLVYAGRFAIAFNANLFAVDSTDPGAADVDEGADPTLTEAFALANAAVLPLDLRVYPEQDYVDGDGVASKVETISYFLHPDTITGRSDVYVLYRRVNARDSVQIVRGLHVPADSSFFNYQRPIAGTLTRIADSRLPLYWDSVAVDSVTAVGIRAAGYFRDRLTGAETIRTVQWTTVIPNAGVAADAGCGSAPAAVTGVGHNKVTSSPSPYHVQVTWTASTDDIGGALDVRYYLVGIRQNAATDYRVVGSVQGRGLANYRWDHRAPADTGSVKYGVRAIDCGGNASVWITHNSALNLP